MTHTSQNLPVARIESMEEGYYPFEKGKSTRIFEKIKTELYNLLVNCNKSSTEFISYTLN